MPPPEPTCFFCDKVIPPHELEQRMSTWMGWVCDGCRPKYEACMKRLRHHILESVESYLFRLGLC